MTPSGEAKKAGLSSLNDVIKETGQSRQTLGNWLKNKPDLFRVVIAGCVAISKNNTTEE